MKFKHRLAYYLFGLTMGAFVVVFIFNKRGQDFCYLPNCRVLKDLREKGLRISKEAGEAMTRENVAEADLEKTLQYGDVDFGKSNKPRKEGGKLYIIEGRNTANQPVILEVANYADKAVLLDIKKQ